MHGLRGIPTACTNITKLQDQQTPLHRACKGGSLNVISLLIEHGAEVNCKDIVSVMSWTPLKFDTSNDHVCTNACTVESTDPIAHSLCREDDRTIQHFAFDSK